LSPYTYVALKNAITTAHGAGSVLASGPGKGSGEFLRLNFRIHSDGRVGLLPSFHLEGLSPDGLAGPFAPVWCDLLGPEDRILWSHHCHFGSPHDDPDAPELLLHELIPWHPETQAIVFRRYAEVCHRYDLEEAPQKIAFHAPQRSGEGEEIMSLAWGPARMAASLTYFVRYSHDGGATWRAIAADLTESRCAVNLHLLPGGEDCRFQVVASSGIRTTVSETEPFALPVRAVRAYILSPASDADFREGEAVVFRGFGFSPNYETTRFDDMLWSSGLDGNVGVGYECAVSTLRPGRHRITLSVPDQLGGEATAGVIIEVHPAD